MAVLAAFIMPHPPVILPEVGHGKEKDIQKTIESCNETSRRIAALKPDTVVLTSPHSIMYADYFHISPGKTASGDLSRFGACDVVVETQYDSEFVQELAKTAQEEDLPAGTLGEKDKALDHATIIPLRFLKQQYADFKSVRIGLSGLSSLVHYRLGKCIAKTAEKLNRRVVIVASGDLSHKLKEDGPYGFHNSGPKFDNEITLAMAESDFLRFLDISPDLCDEAAECGLRSFIIMAGALDRKSIRAELLSYENTFGVGYAVCAYEIKGNDDTRCFDIIYEEQQNARIKAVKSEEDEYVKLARLSLETYIKTGKRCRLPDVLPDSIMHRRAGVFVSLKKFGHLRGCIGTITPVANCVGEEILRNAISAGAEDPRFPPVTQDELNELVYSVDVLADAQPIQSVEELDVKRYGVIVSSGYKRGLLLPNLEGVDSPEQQVSIALQKAGIKANENYTMERFEVVRHK